MKESIIKIYNVIINTLIDFFHVQKKKLFRTFSRIKRLFKNFCYYEVLGFKTIVSGISNIFKKILITKTFVSFKEFNKKIINFINQKIKHILKKYNDYLINIREINNTKVSNLKDNYSKFLTPKIMMKTGLLAALSVFLIYDAYSWFYNEYQSRGTNLTFGTVKHEVIQYTNLGEIIGESGDTLTVIEEDNLANTYKNTRYISVKNIGSLDIDYSLSFTLDGTTSNAGVLYYRVYDITNEVISSTITQTNDTRIKAYAAENPTPANLETDPINPVSNLTTIPQVIISGQIDKDKEDDDNNIRYYRIDYGMYQTVTSSLYSDASVAVHANVYTTQKGIDSSLNNEGQTWLVENELQFREAVLNALSGDTIKLAENISIDGTVDFTKRVHLNTDIYNLTITGDLTYDFVEIGSLTIDTTSGGKIDIGGNLYMNTPKSKIHFIGQNQTYDIFVGEVFTVNGIQNEEEDGVLLEGVRIVKNKVGNIPVDIVVMSNTRLTIAPNVVVNYVIAAKNSTNIEILNNGIITQIQLQDMNLIDSFSKYQIYVYNLNTILGVLGGSSIILPPTSNPYTGPNTGNTLIIRGVSSNDISVSGSQGYIGSDISQGAPTDSVIPIQGEIDSYYVYIRDNNETLQGLLEAYFNELDSSTSEQKIHDIKKLIMYTMNSAYFENEDFDYIGSSALGSLEYLGLANATISDGNTVNKIANNTLKNNTTLKTLILSKTLTNIGSNAFANANLGRIPTTGAFSFLSIPTTVVNIGSGAFASTRYVNFEGQVPPTIGSDAFNNSSNGTKFFVSMGAIEAYRNATNINSAYVYYAGALSDNKQYFLYNYNNGYGISYFINNVSIGSSLTIPNTGSLLSVTKNITAIGYNAYRGLTTDASGAAITIPTTIDLIDSYAFYSDNITSINLDNVTTINNYSFYNTNLNILIADNLLNIGDYAFYSTPITYLSLEHVESIGKYAFARCDTLFEANLGTVSSIDNYAFSNCPNLGRVWFKNTNIVTTYSGDNIDLTVGENAVFTNWGSYLDGRLRVYVPSGVGENSFNYLEGYKKIFSANEEYIYPAGEIVGSYVKSPIPYDWGEYSVKSVTKPDSSGNLVSAYEMIEYHGENLTSTYQLPENMILGEDLTAKINGSFWNNGVINVFNGTISITNNTDSNVSDWTVELNAPTGITNFSASSNGIVTVENNMITVKNTTSNGTISAGSTKTISITYNSTSESIKATPTIAYSSSTPTMTIISIGEYAFRHAKTVSNNTIDLVTNSLLHIDNHGLENISVSSLYSTSLISIGNYGLYNTDLKKVVLPNLKSLGSYAMSGMDTLYSADIGNVKTLGDHAISDNPNLEQLFIRNTDTSNMVVASTALTNIGTNANNRMRIYVPDSGTCLAFYNELLSAYSKYIYPIGEIVGNFINSPIPYDIGEYAVRPISINLRDGTVSTGYEIIEYHGSNLTSSYKIPKTINVNGENQNIISIGDKAFINVESINGTSISINNNTLISIGSSAFKEVKGIVSFESNSLQYLSENAFDGSSLTYFSATNLNTLESYALANMNKLYRINLGKVSWMDANSLYKLDNLTQVFFTPHTDTLVFNQNAITEVGASTSNRIRFYVDKAEHMEESYQTTPRDLDVSYEVLSETSQGSALTRRYYYEFRVTITNNNEDDVSSWSTRAYLSTNGVFTGTTGVEYETSGQYVTFNNANANGTLASGDSISFTFTAQTSNRNTFRPTFSNTTGEHVETTLVKNSISVVDTYANSFRSEYRDFFYLKGSIIGSYSSTNIPVDIGEYSVTLVSHDDTSGVSHEGYEIIEYHGADLNSSFVIPTELTVGENTYPVIGIGDRAFRWAKMNGTNSFDIVNSSLIYIGNYAFYGLNAKIINLSNTDYIGDYAFYNNKLYTFTANKLIELGKYSLANNVSLNYANVGTVKVIGEGAFYGCTGIEQMYFKSTDADAGSNVMNIDIGTNAFYNTGTLIGKRFRIYVPDGKLSSGATYDVAYKSTLPSALSAFIHPTGYMIGSYTYGTLPYDIGEYSIREVTLKDNYNASITGWEIIEYHGPDLGTSYSSINGTITANGITQNIISVGDYAYYGASIISGQNWNFTLPNSVIEIGDYAFYQTGITSIHANQIVTIGKYAFADCENLTTAIFSGVAEVDDYAFYSCGRISYIDLGTGIESIGAYALWNPYQGGPTTTLNMLTSTVPTTAGSALPDYERGFLGLWFNSNFTISVPTSSLSTFQSSTPWSYHNFTTSSYSSDFLFVIDNNNEITINSYTGSSLLVTIPDTLPVNGTNYNVTNIKGTAFDSNHTITSLTLPRYLKTVGDGFLDGNRTINTIIANENSTVFSSNNGVLYNSNGDTLIKYPNGKISNDYTIPSTVKVIAYKAFSGQENLETVTFNNELIAIGAYAFKGCNSLIGLYFSSTPPYLTGFDTFPTNVDMKIYVPTANLSEYNSSTYFSKYSSYLEGN